MITLTKIANLATADAQLGQLGSIFIERATDTTTGNETYRVWINGGCLPDGDDYAEYETADCAFAAAHDLVEQIADLDD